MFPAIERMPSASALSPSFNGEEAFKLLREDASVPRMLRSFTSSIAPPPTMPERRFFSFCSAAPPINEATRRPTPSGRMNLGIIGLSRPGLPSKTIPSLSASIAPVTSTKTIPIGAERNPRPNFGPIAPPSLFSSTTLGCV